MSKYILNKTTALVVKGNVYVLAREKKISGNSVCDKCALYDFCVDIEENHKLTDFCIPEDNDERWFFLEHRIFSVKGVVEIVESINSCFTINM